MIFFLNNMEYIFVDYVSCVLSHDGNVAADCIKDLLSKVMASKWTKIKTIKIWCVTVVYTFEGRYVMNSLF